MLLDHKVSGKLDYMFDINIKLSWPYVLFTLCTIVDPLFIKTCGTVICFRYY